MGPRSAVQPPDPPEWRVVCEEEAWPDGCRVSHCTQEARAEAVKAAAAAVAEAVVEGSR